MRVPGVIGSSRTGQVIALVITFSRARLRREEILRGMFCLSRVMARPAAPQPARSPPPVAARLLASRVPGERGAAPAFCYYRRVSVRIRECL